MAKLYNLARMTTATTGTGTITLGSAVSGYLTFALTGVANGDVVDYAIKDGSNSEHGTGTYTSSGTTLTRTVTKSTNSNAAISLSGTAEVFISPRAETLNDASLLTTGTVAQARLGSGSGGAGTKALFDDQTYKTISNAGQYLSFESHTASATITIPAGATKGEFTIGGATGGAALGTRGAPGGGSAQIKTLTGLTPGNTLAWTSGAGGTTTPGAGGTSTLASGTQTIATLTCIGGTAGATGGGAGGTLPTSGDFNVAGQRGGEIGGICGCLSLPGNGGMTGLGLSVAPNGNANTVGLPGIIMIRWYTS
jgi:hypothetical protein